MNNVGSFPCIDMFSAHCSVELNISAFFVIRQITNWVAVALCSTGFQEYLLASHSRVSAKDEAFTSEILLLGLGAASEVSSTLERAALHSPDSSKGGQGWLAHLSHFSDCAIC